MAFLTKKEVISFREFMARPTPFCGTDTPPTNSIYSIFPPITISSFLPTADPTFTLFLIGCGAVLVIATIEKLMEGAAPEAAGTLGKLVRFSLPAGSFALVFWFLSHL